MTVLLVILFFSVVILVNLACRGGWNHPKKRRPDSRQPEVDQSLNSTMPPIGEAPSNQQERPPRIAA